MRGSEPGSEHPCTALGVKLIQELQAQGRGINLIEHDIHNVMKPCDRACVMKNGQLIGTVNANEVTDDEILVMIIMGKKPAKTA